MAVRTSNFEIAAQDAAEVSAAEENVAELRHGGGRISLWRRPTPGAYSVFQLRLSRSRGNERAKGIDLFFARLVLTPAEAIEPGRTDGDGVEYRQRVEDGEIVVGWEQFMAWMEDGIVDETTLLELLSEVVELHAGFPTSSPPASSESPTTSGPSSTARSRRVGSTPSA